MMLARKATFVIMYGNTEESLRETAILREKLKEKGVEFTEMLNDCSADGVAAWVSTEAFDIYEFTVETFDECFKQLKFVNGEWCYEISSEEEEYLEKLYKETMKRATYDPDDHDYGDEDQNAIMREINHYDEDPKPIQDNQNIKSRQPRNTNTMTEPDEEFPF